MELYTKICKMCGKEFQTKYKTRTFCYEPHFLTCCICGKEFEVPSNNILYYYERKDNVTCSRKCSYELGCKRTSPQERHKRIVESFQKKYGVSNPGQLQSTKEKRVNTNIQRYGCAAPINSLEIRSKMVKTCQEKYGVDFVTQSQQFKDAARKTCRERYGVDNYNQTEEFQEKSKKTMMERYGVEHALQSAEILEQRRQHNIEVYGVDHPMKTEEGKQKMFEGIAARHDGNSKYNNLEKNKQTIRERYGTDYYFQSEDCKEKTRLAAQEKYSVDHHLQAQEVIEKRKATCIEKYGSDNVFSSEYGMQKIRETMLEKYGIINPSQNKEFKEKATRNSRNSKLETRIFDLFVNYDIEFQHHYFIRDDKTGCSHEFDFYLPKYKALIDADGIYFHSYLNDPDGARVNDYYDDIRTSLVPEDHTFHVIIEGNEDQQVKQLVNILEEIDSGIFEYDSYLFNWCRSIDFPYPDYETKRLTLDWSSLCNYQNVSYKPQCRIGESIIKQFHKSIYDCRRYGSVSPVEGWYDDNKLKQVIKNRLIYINDVDPSKILRGFNISKICPVVSIFNPILAKYIVSKYLPDTNEIFDPFSGFSGRMLGVASYSRMTDRKISYIGQDLNSIAVSESTKIIDLLNISDICDVSQKDVLESTGEYECLMTCPPYGKKELYNNEIIFKSCDGWIDECIHRFDCNRYVFVVDETFKYSEFVKEEIKSTSHFSDVKERIVVIDKSDIK